MGDDLILDPFRRMLDELGDEPWPALAESGFLDLLAGAEAGGAGLGLAEVFPLAFETGRRAKAPPVIETMLARLVDPAALDVTDPGAALAAGGVAAQTARALAAAASAALMAGAMDALQAMTSTMPAPAGSSAARSASSRRCSTRSR